jgi:hypothetical protein
MASQLELDEAMAAANWRIDTPISFVTAFRSSLAKYLIEQRARRMVDPSLKAVDYIRFQTALNVLKPYYACLEVHLRAASDAAFVTSKTIDQLANEADAKCAEPKRVAFTAIDYKGPDFHGFDPIADGDAPSAETAVMLMHIQQFAISYNAALRGADWRKAIATTVVPDSVPLR